jgi:hypothetical protein
MAVLAASCALREASGSSGTRSVRISWGNASSRTILPAHLPQNMTYDVTLTPFDSSAKTVSHTSITDTSVVDSDLAPCAYSILVEGKNSAGNVVAKASGEISARADNGQDVVCMTLSYITDEGTGSAHLSFDFSNAADLSVDSVSVGLIAPDRTSSTYSLTGTKNVFPFTLDSVKSGLYQVLITATAGNKTAVRSENLYVFRNVDTDASLSISPAEFIGVPLSLAGSVTTLAGVGTSYADGQGCSATFVPSAIPQGQDFSRQYRMYMASDGTNNYVSDYFHHVIRRIDQSGNVTTYAGTPGVPGNVNGALLSASFDTPQGIAYYGGKLYVADTFNRLIRVIDINSGVVSTLRDLNLSDSYYPCALTTDGTYLYAVETDFKSTTSYRIMKITISGDAATTLNLSGGLSNPYGIAVIGSTLYVPYQYCRPNYSVCYIAKIVLNGNTGTVNLVAGSTSSRGTTDAALTSSTFTSINGIAADGTDLLVSDNNVSKYSIRKIWLGENKVTTIFTGNAANNTYGEMGSISVDSNSYYVVNDTDVRIVKISRADNSAALLAGSRSSGLVPVAGASGTAIRFAVASTIAADSGYVYVEESDFNRFRKINIASGIESDPWVGEFSITGGYQDGPGSTALFNSPGCMQVVGKALYVYDSGNKAIRRIDLATDMVSTFVGPSAGFTAVTAMASDGKDLYVIDSGNLKKIDLTTAAVASLGPILLSSVSGFVTDGINVYCIGSTDHDLVYHFTLTNIKSSELFAGGAVSYADGIGGAAGFGPGCNSLISDGTYLYLSDPWNRCVRKIRIATQEVSTIAGNRLTPGLVNGTGTGARFVLPEAIASDGKSIFVLDELDETVQKIQ